MNIEHITGCVSEGTYIDDKPLNNYTVEELRELVKKAIDHVDCPYVFQAFFESLAIEQGTLEYSDYCEQCGDTTDKYIFICK